MPEPAQSLGELKHSLNVYERERDNLLLAIREARTEARRTAIESAACRQHIEQATIDRWQRAIKERSAELLQVEQKIGGTNKALRALRANGSQPIKALSHLPRDVAVKEEPAKEEPVAAVQSPTSLKEGHILFLQFFRQLAIENIDPRLIKVFDKDAHALVNDYRRMHGEPL